MSALPSPATRSAWASLRRRGQDDLASWRSDPGRQQSLWRRRPRRRCDRAAAMAGPEPALRDFAAHAVFSVGGARAHAEAGKRRRRRAVGDALDGVALVIRHSDSTIDLNDQSPPVNSCSVTSKRFACSANAVSRAATSPIALTVSEKVIDFGENHRADVGALDRVQRLHAERERRHEGMRSDSTSTFVPSSSTHETASRVLNPSCPFACSSSATPRSDNA